MKMWAYLVKAYNPAVLTGKPQAIAANREQYQRSRSLWLEITSTGQQTYLLSEGFSQVTDLLQGNTS
jgi:hypothetical protein